VVGIKIERKLKVAIIAIEWVLTSERITGETGAGRLRKLRGGLHKGWTSDPTNIRRKVKKKAHLNRRLKETPKEGKKPNF